MLYAYTFYSKKHHYSKYNPSGYRTERIVSNPLSKVGELARVQITDHNHIRDCMYPSEMNREIIEFKHKISKVKTSIKNFNRVKLKGFKSYEVNLKFRNLVLYPKNKLS